MWVLRLHQLRTTVINSVFHPRTHLTVLCMYLQSVSKNSQSRPRSSSTGHVQLWRILIGQVSNLSRTGKDHVAERLLTLPINPEALQLESVKRRRRQRRKAVLPKFQVVPILLGVSVSRSFVEFLIAFPFFFKTVKIRAASMHIFSLPIQS